MKEYKKASIKVLQVDDDIVRTSFGGSSGGSSSVGGGGSAGSSSNGYDSSTNAWDDVINDFMSPSN